MPDPYAPWLSKQVKAAERNAELANAGTAEGIDYGQRAKALRDALKQYEEHPRYSVEEIARVRGRLLGYANAIERAVPDRRALVTALREDAAALDTLTQQEGGSDAQVSTADSVTGGGAGNGPASENQGCETHGRADCEECYLEALAPQPVSQYVSGGEANWVLSTILDALRWTEPEEVDAAAFAVLAEGLELLSDGLPATGRVESWVVAVLEAGWNLAPSLEQVEQDTSKPQVGEGNG